MSLDNSTENRDLEEKEEIPKNEHNEQGEQNENNEHIPTLEDKPLKEYIGISILCFLIAFGGFVFGFDTGTISGFINMTDFLERFGGTKSDGTL